MKKLFKRGFTLIELIIVIAILAILCVLLVPKIAIFKDKSEVVVNRNNIRALKGALGQYRAENDSYPKTSNLNTLETLLTTLNNNSYIDKLPVYKDGTKIIKTYEENNDNYTIEINDDKSTFFNEDGVKLTDGTDTNKLFR